jgi:hypothetical protein
VGEPTGEDYVIRHMEHQPARHGTNHRFMRFPTNFESDAAALEDLRHLLYPRGGGCNHAPNSEHDLFMPEAFYEECVEAQQQGRGGA